MSVTRDLNLRSGDIHESLGILLMQTVSAVATISRTEDVGIDAICTLLEPRGRTARADRTLYLQIKAQSKDKICLPRTEFIWLSELELPFFYGVVNRKNNSISIYSIEKAVQRYHPLNSYDFESCTFVFSDGVSDDHNNIFLGPPIVVWDLSDTYKNPTKSSEIFKLLTSWVNFSSENIFLRKQGINLKGEWQTGEPPKRIGSSVSSNNVPLNAQRFVENILPIALQAKFLNDMEIFKNIESLLGLIKSRGLLSSSETEDTSSLYHVLLQVLRES